MPDEKIPPSPVPRTSMSVTRDKIRMGAFTDWLAIVSVTILIALDKIPWELGLPIIATIGGVGGVMKARGNPGSALLLIAAPLLKLLGAKHGVHLIALLTPLLMFGCGASGVTAGQAVKTLLPVAADALRGLAAERGVEIDENGAACFEAPEIEIEQFEGVGIVALVCVAPYLEE